jgi:hypothetical protein
MHALPRASTSPLGCPESRPLAVETRHRSRKAPRSRGRGPRYRTAARPSATAASQRNALQKRKISSGLTSGRPRAALRASIW